MVKQRCRWLLKICVVVGLMALAAACTPGMTGVATVETKGASTDVVDTATPLPTTIAAPLVQSDGSLTSTQPVHTQAPATQSLAATQTPTGQPQVAVTRRPGNTAPELAKLQLSGSILGFCDQLIVRRDGSATNLNDCTKQQKDFEMNAQDLERLRSVVDQFGPYIYTTPSSFKGTDPIYIQLHLFGRGPTNAQPDQEQTNALVELLRDILIQSR